MDARLSSPVEQIEPHYTVVVIGSGYGASILASRLARAGQRVAVLERGREIRPGEYPNTMTSTLREMQIDAPEGHLGSKTGLLDLRANSDINVLVGCGLGGTSLINANVSIWPDLRVFDDPVWPRALREDVREGLAQGYHRAEEMLRPQRYPDSFPALEKYKALKVSAEALKQPCYRVPLNVTFQDGVNHVGVEQRACVLCGDCVTGCNFRAKNSLIMNYLPDAKAHGAEIFTGCSVRRVERKDGKWLVHYRLAEGDQERFDAPDLFVAADLVFLGAGSLGSTEILLRSSEAGLGVSTRLGERFTGNGDFIGFGFDNDIPVNGVGFGDNAPEGMEPVGPTITGVIDMRRTETLDGAIIIEEGAIPGAIGPILATAFIDDAILGGEERHRGFVEAAKQIGRTLESLVLGPRKGATKSSQTYLAIGNDDDMGQMSLHNDRLRIAWPGIGDTPLFESMHQRLLEATQATGGIYDPDPLWSKELGHRLITVHPLGGCVMGDDAEHGVVDHMGRVFAGQTGTETHEGLYVCDGAILPRPLGVNPLLTISALAERAAGLIARDHGWTIDYSLGHAPEPGEPEAIGVQFTEAMKGFFSPSVKDDYQRGHAQGEAEDSPFELILTIASENLDEMLERPDHAAGLVGSAMAPALSPKPLMATDGLFNLFVGAEGDPTVRHMLYKMRLTSEEGRSYWFEGVKTLRDGPPAHAWPEATTLYVTIHDGPDPDSPVLGKGILRIAPADFARQLTTMKAPGAHGTFQRLEALSRFGKFFIGTLFDLYGGALGRFFGHHTGT